MEQQNHTQAFSLAVKLRSDKLMNYFLTGFFLTGLVLAVFFGTWLIALGVGGLSLLAYYATKIALPDSVLYQYVLSVVLGLFMAQYIYQMHGLFEMHFFAFIGSAILITYQNWKLQIPMLIVVLVHHGILGYLQNIGYDKVYFTQLDSFELQTFAIHIVLSGVIFFTCGLWAYQLKKYSQVQIRQIVEMNKLQQEAILAEDAHKRATELRSVALDKAVAQGKFEMASDVLHDIGNAIVGFGSYLLRIRRMQEEDQPENLEKLVDFFETRQSELSTAIGEDKARAVVKMLSGIVEVHHTRRQEMNASVTEQLNITAHIQEILHIQRQYITGKETQERKLVNFRVIIQDGLSILSSSIEKTGIAISLEIPDEFPLIKGDRTKLVQVILSLLKNSIEAIDVQAKQKSISISLLKQDDQFLIHFKDSGCGFAGAAAARLFERGFTTKTAAKGLGLYNCREILEGHEGHIAVTSAGPGKGAIATIQFRV
jgi:two-component system, sensor histidine kinase and response regulator